MTDSPPQPEAALLFDLDGTLVDTWEANYRSYHDSLAESGFVCQREAFAPCFGGHWREFLPTLAEGADEALLHRIHHRKLELFSTHVGTVRINIPLIALLRSARPRWRTGLVTSASRVNTVTLLDHFGIASHFDRIVTGDDIDRPKPAADGYLRCMADLDVEATASLAFEDAPAGIAAACAAGLQVVVITAFARRHITDS